MSLDQRKQPERSVLGSRARECTSTRRLWLAAGLSLVAACGEAADKLDDYLPVLPGVPDANTGDAAIGWDGTLGGYDSSLQYDAAVDAEDAGEDAASDGGLDAGDGGTDAGEGGSLDAGDAGDASSDGGNDAGTDAAVDASTDAALDASTDASTDAAVDAGTDAAVDASTDAGADAAVDGGVANFPRPGEAVNVVVAGPYTTAHYDDGVQNNEYNTATVYYPTNASAPFAAIALCPGYLQTKADLTWLAEMLASHGIVALTLTPTNNFAGVAPRAADLTAALLELRGENTRTGGPLLGKLDLTRLGVMGHGEGGGAALSVANTQGTQLRAVVPLQSSDNAAYPNVKAAAIFIAGEDDIVAPVSSNAFAHYQSIPAPIKKVFAEIDNEGHSISVVDAVTGQQPSAAEKALQTRHILSFLKIYLEDDLRYQTYVYGLEHGKDASAFSRYLTAP